MLRAGFRLVTRYLTRIEIFLLASSLMPILVAYTAQHVFHIEPCKLCLYQRVPFFVILALSVSLFMTKNYAAARIACFTCAFLFAVNGALSFYHAGVEYGIFRNAFKCMDVGNSSAQSIEDIYDQLLGSGARLTMPSCEKALFRFVGISFAGWNFIYCTACAIIALILPSINKKSSEDRNHEIH